MKIFQNRMVLCLGYLIFIATTYGQESSCPNYFDGFSLAEDYNRNSPPMPANNAGKIKKFKLHTMNTLREIYKVTILVVINL